MTNDKWGCSSKIIRFITRYFAYASMSLPHLFCNQSGGLLSCVVSGSRNLILGKEPTTHVQRKACEYSSLKHKFCFGDVVE